METGPPAQLADGGPEPSVGRIPALDGVRAIGIVLVLFFHGGFAWAGGGFFGVDVFFVLSGFLITGLLISEFRQNSHVGLVRFWMHRVRRLVPALLALLAAVALYAFFFAPPDTLGQLRGDALATLFYGQNWHLIAGGTGYFADLNTPRPLLHTWSLSIEEQFYVIWPLVVLGVLHVTRSLRVLLALTLAGALASAGAMAYLFHGGAGESRAYYGTDTRAQALLIGAALAIVLAHPVVPRGARAPRVGGATSLVRPFRLSRMAQGGLVALGGAGLAVVAWMSVTDNSATVWIYHGGFALVAVATAAVVACVALVPSSPWARALSVRPVRYVGAISYGLYLWHWPIFVLLDNARTGLLGWPLFVVRMGAAFGVAAVSYHFLEMPIRRGALRGWRGWAATPLAVGGAAVLAVVSTAGAAPALGTQTPGSPSSASSASSSPAATTPAATSPASSSSASSSSASSSPPPAASQAGDQGTAAIVPVVPEGTGGPIRVLLVGDSEASFLGFGLGPDSAQYGVTYAGDGVFGCGLVQGETMFHGTLVSQATGERGGQVAVPCATQLIRWKADVEAFHPDVVMVADGEYEVRNQLMGGTWTHLGEPAFDAAEQAAVQAAVDALRSTGAVVVLLTAPYYQQQEQLDGSPWPEDDPARVDAYNGILTQVANASGNGVVVADLNARLDPGGQFAQYIDGIDVRYADGIHVTAAGAKLVSPWLLADVAHLGAANRAIGG